MNLKFTKQEFRTLMDLSLVDIRPNDIVYYKDKKYELEVLMDVDLVVLKEVKE